MINMINTWINLLREAINKIVVVAREKLINIILMIIKGDNNVFMTKLSDKSF